VLLSVNFKPGQPRQKIGGVEEGQHCQRITLTLQGLPKALSLRSEALLLLLLLLKITVNSIIVKNG
jgi:hypothetical protein